MVKSKALRLVSTQTMIKQSPLPYHAQAEVRNAGRPLHIPNLLASISISVPGIGLDVLRSLPTCKFVTMFQLFLKQIFVFLGNKKVADSFKDKQRVKVVD